MKKAFIRSSAAQSAHRHENFVAVWSAVMWALAGAYLLAFHFH